MGQAGIFPCFSTYLLLLLRRTERSQGRLHIAVLPASPLGCLGQQRVNVGGKDGVI